MTGTGHTTSTRRHAAAAVTALALLASLFAVAPATVFAAAPIVSNVTGGGSISLDRTSDGSCSGALCGTYVSLSGPTFSGTGGEFTTGAITFDAPVGFAWQPGTVSATAGGTACSGLNASGSNTQTTVTINVTGSNSGGCFIAVTGLAARPTNTTPQSGATSLINLGTQSAFTTPLGAGANVGSLTSVAGAPAALAFSSYPGPSQSAGNPFDVQPSVRARDQFANLVQGASITLDVQGGSSQGAVLCDNNTVQTNGSGFANFSGCYVNTPSPTPSSFYQLTAQATGQFAPFIVGGNFFVGAGTATRLVFEQQPASSTPATLSPQPWVRLANAGGGFVTQAGVAVTLTIIDISGSPGATLTCNELNNTAVTDSIGRARFTNCTVNRPGQYFLIASPLLGSTITPGNSSVFTVTGASSGQVVFTTQPLGATGGTVPTAGSGAVWGIQPVVELRTTNNTPMTWDNQSTVTLSIASGTGSVSGTLSCSGGTTRTVSLGRATWQGCSITGAGTNYQLRATVTNSAFPQNIATGTNGTSNPFSIIASTALIAFTTQPLGASTGFVPTGPAGTPFSIQPVVTLRDINGAVLSGDFVSQVTLSITPSTPTSGTAGVLTCTNGNSRTVVAGVATFAGCQISAAGTAYQLRATVSFASSFITLNVFTDSLPFTLTQSVAQIALTTYPSVVTWGDPFTATIQFTGTGNHAWQLQRLSAPDNNVWQTVLSGTTDSTGRAVVQYTPRFNGQYKVVFAGDATLGAGTSNIRTVNVRNLVLIRPEWSGVRTVSAGYTQTYNATVRPVPSGGLPGGVARVEFVFYQLQGGTWVKVKSIVVPLNSSGVGTLKYTWNAAGIWYMRARTLANPYNFIGTSPVQRMNVK